MVDGQSELAQSRTSEPSQKACLSMGIAAVRQRSAMGLPPDAVVRKEIPRDNGVASVLACGRCAVEVTVLHDKNWTAVPALMANDSGQPFSGCVLKQI